MNYHILKQIVNNLSTYSKITKAKRVGENKINLELGNSAENLSLIIDLQGVNSSISSGKIYAPQYKSAFDLQLERLAGAKITAQNVSAINRIWRIDYERTGAYKRELGSVVIEFLGRKNNLILLDAKGQISSALRYVSDRNILQNAPYREPESAGIKDKEKELINFKDFLNKTFSESKNSTLEALKSTLQNSLVKKKSTLQKRLDELLSEEQLSAQASELYARGELLKANLYKLNHYDRNFELDGVKFALQSPPAMALRGIFKSAKRRAAQASGIKQERANLLSKIAEINNSICALNSCDDENILRLSYAKKEKSRRASANSHILEFYINDYKISVGLNENANSELLSRAKKSDWWFHLQGEPGAHAILQTAKKQPDIDIIYQTALLAAAHSGKKNGAFMVDFTQRGKLHRSGASAHVTYNEFDSIKVFLKD